MTVDPELFNCDGDVGEIRRDARRFIAIINSMTAIERALPRMVDGERAKRIADGSGTNLTQVRLLLQTGEVIGMGRGERLQKWTRKGGDATRPNH